MTNDSRELEDDRHCPRCHAAYSRAFRVCPRDGVALVAGGDPLLGSVLLATYRVSHKLGSGALGRVYAAQHMRVPRAYAVKFPRGMWVDHPKSRARLFVEAMAAGRLSHPNVAAVVDVGETDRGVPFLVMQLAPGESLHAYLARHRPLPVLEALALARQLASGLAHAHGEGVIHRDLKPENVMILDGHLQIVDFGIAIIGELGDRGRFTTEGVVVGTPYYMAPEQLLGGAITERSDLYALGVMIYELVAGCRPFAGSAIEVASQVVSARAPAMSDRVPGLVVTAELEAMCAALLARDPELRPHAAAEVVDAIDRVRDALGGVPPEEPRQRVSSPRLAQASAPPSTALVVSAHAPTVETDRIEKHARRWWHWLMPWRG